MNKINSYKKFLEKNQDLMEFPVKKFLSIIRDRINNKIKEGDNIFIFDFLKEITLPIKFNLKITYNKSNKDFYRGGINEDNVKSHNFNGFDLILNISDNNYDQIYSIINHELKHVYDLYYDVNRESFDSVSGYNFLRTKYSNNKFILDFVELSNLALKHELDARLSMIYDKLRWLKTYDKDQLKDEFKKTYVYRSLNMLNNFNYLNIVNNVNIDYLITFTNEFIKYFTKSETIVKDKNDLIIFYKNTENNFKILSDKYLDKCDEILEELIRDKKPYVENKLFTSNPDLFKVNEEFLQEILNKMFE